MSEKGYDGLIVWGRVLELLHVADERAFRQDGGDYAPQDYASVGFIHCCLPAQLSGVLERWFTAKDRVLLLTLDAGQLEDTLRAEPGPGGQLFPHIYGKIPRRAVLASIELQRNAFGQWVLPALLPGRSLPTAQEMARAFHTAYANAASGHGVQLLPGQEDYEGLNPTMRALLEDAMGQVRAMISGWGEPG